MSAESNVTTTAAPSSTASSRPQLTIWVTIFTYLILALVMFGMACTVTLDALKETVKARMEKSMSEILHWNEYNYVLINRSFGETLKTIKSIISVEKTRLFRNTGVNDFVASLNNEFLEIK